MRTLLKVSLDTVAANAAILEGRLETMIAESLSALNPEAVYFTAIDGKRTALIFFDLKNSSDVPSIAEPWFVGVNAAVDFSPAMNLDDLKAGLQKATALRGAAR